jgi:cytosine/adenosine deaminase-related metal-dependent hydrolase
MMASLLIKNAQAIVTVDNQDHVFERYNILIEGNRIAAIGDQHWFADTVIDATHMIVYPGLVNTHHHLYQTFTRNLPAVQHMELFDWLRTLYGIWRGLTEDMMYYSSLTGLGELLKYGCTTCFDHHYVFPQQRSNLFVDRQFDAAADVGIRFHASRGSMSRGKSDGGLPPDELVQNIHTILTDSLRLVENYHDVRPYSMRQVVLAPCSPFSVTADLMTETEKLARVKQVRLHTHLAETKDEEEYCLQTRGLRPLDYMESLGWVGPDVWYAHGIHFNEQELQKLADTQTGIAHCPVSNQKLSSGIAQLPRMLELGVPVGLAVDGSASNDSSNLLSELRSCYLLHRLASSAKAPGGYDLLRLATRGGAALLGRTDIGSIEVGKAADLFLLRTDRLEYVGAQFDPKSLLATVGVNRPVDYTIVNGRIVVKNGELCTIDEQRTAQQANKLVQALVKGIR